MLTAAVAHAKPQLVRRKFQLRAHLYQVCARSSEETSVAALLLRVLGLQARQLAAADDSGLSDPYALVLPALLTRLVSLLTLASCDRCASAASPSRRRCRSRR